MCCLPQQKNGSHQQQQQQQPQRVKHWRFSKQCLLTHLPRKQQCFSEVWLRFHDLTSWTREFGAQTLWVVQYMGSTCRVTWRGFWVEGMWRMRSQMGILWLGVRSLLGFHPFFVYMCVLFRCLLCDFLVMVKPLHITDVHRIFTGKSIMNCFVLFTQDFCSTKYISEFCTCLLSHVWMHVQHCPRSIWNWSMVHTCRFQHGNV